MNIVLSNTSEKPLYQQIKDQIKSSILKGELKNGELLPSIRNFSTDLRVSVLTIRRVYDELEKEGFVKSQAGKGTFVLAGNTDLMKDTKRLMVEDKMFDMVSTAKAMGISKKELMDMMDIIYEEV
ncbi:GntR family transcriptional regulator [Clostridium tetanomorphum]|uniref:GntR family transcriptional regulator n=1 Tax=Clostridium tetanomorphum TaxID=1553 RepID=A0A923E5K1_CLOTT|nr:GntR family transcriptional regulator [Clostridium tetanomorphum]KAJ52684.1 GntR family transcriptional regulator [Clostridium tetanomorphum DSM 665]MBC2396763.1 GntR family transcriptional regulator [Clostridium tetanomorphum]MBP1863277.1 GntR family transcriptional regulator [Clostridium tetanomorphum]NRS84385.1 GntR family transcriptional regulator [Clostridium tetanomorphum]NRZ97600.1 GntR family transcriptional regulator [Clostridium tetanomorphum]